MQNRKSAQLFKKAQKVIPGGVNSPVRAFKSVGGKTDFSSKEPRVPACGMRTATVISITVCRGGR